jgi:hypothetical protein
LAKSLLTKNSHPAVTLRIFKGPNKMKESKIFKVQRHMSNLGLFNYITFQANIIRLDRVPLRIGILGQNGWNKEKKNKEKSLCSYEKV